MATPSHHHLQSRRCGIDGESCGPGLSNKKQSRIVMGCRMRIRLQRIDVPPGSWSFVEQQLGVNRQPFTSESTLKVPFSNAFATPHNSAILGASDKHAEIWGEGSRLARDPIGNADFCHGV